MQPLPESEYGAWDRFVAGLKTATVFHTAWWHRAWDADVTIHARKNENGVIEAGIPLHISAPRMLPGFLNIRGIRRPPLTPVNGPVFSECGKTQRCTRYAHVKKELFDAIETLPEVDYYNFGLWRHCTDLMPFVWNGFETRVHYTYVIRAADVEEWRKNMSSNTRRFLKGAHKEAGASGYTVEEEPAFEEIVPLFVETTLVKGLTARDVAARLPRWWEAVRKNRAGKSYLIRDGEGKAICASAMVWDSHTAYYLVSGMKKETRMGSHLNMILVERMVTDALEMGLDFDFEGSTVPGVERFFRGWGGELHPCYMVYKIPSAFAYILWNVHRYLDLHRKPWRAVSNDLGASRD